MSRRCQSEPLEYHAIRWDGSGMALVVAQGHKHSYDMEDAEVRAKGRSGGGDLATGGRKTGASSFTDWRGS